MTNCIIIDKMHPSIVSELELSGFAVDYRPEISREELVQIIGSYQGLILRSKTTVDQALLQKATALQFVARAGAGLDNLDTDALEQQGIKIINAPEGNCDSLAEHATGMLLGLLHNLPAADRSVREGHWKREAHRGMELAGKSVGLIGFGNMGQAFAKRLSSFGCQVMAYDKYKEGFGTDQVKEKTLHEIMELSDILSLHVPLTVETRGFYNYSFFKGFSKPLILLNTARGEILPLLDLVRLMKEHKILKAGLDVIENEPISQLVDKQNDIFEYISKSQDILLSPHVAGWSHESYQRINQILAKKIVNLPLGRPLE